MARRVRRTTETTEDLDALVADYLLNRSTRERSSYHEDTYKKRFLALLAETGELQEGGHRILRLNEPVVFHEYKGGKSKERDIAGIRRVRRSSTSLNEERTMAFLAKKKMLDQCVTMQPVINEDAILAANFEGTISDDDLAKLYDESETFAFYFVEGDRSERRPASWSARPDDPRPGRCDPSGLAEVPTQPCRRGGPRHPSVRHAPAEPAHQPGSHRQP